jgi:ubiquinone/menaquinone biosynthesis C-methylase UbiE
LFQREEFSMDIWKFFDITHRDHLLCNPLNADKVDEMISLLQLPPNAHVLELATGKGEFLIRLIERYGATAVAVDTSPYCIRDFTQKLVQRTPEADVQLLEMDGANYQPQPGEQFDLAACLGASWIFGGHSGTLNALQKMVRPGGLILVGEPFLKQDPDPAYLEAAGFKPDTFGRHVDNVVSGEAFGLTLLHSIVSSEDDWDRYEGLQWQAAVRYGQENPDDPDVPHLQQRVAEQKLTYLRWGRETLGWALYLFQA